MELLAATDASHVLDCTLGSGGHSGELLRRGGRVTAIDRDPAARRTAAMTLAAYGDRCRILAGDFAGRGAALAEAGETFDGVLADLGVSSPMLDDDAYGMGLRQDSPLDMRMDPALPTTALDLIASNDEDALADILFRLGEERRSRRIARALKAAWWRGATTCAEMAAAVRAAVPGHQRRHPALRTFQALRIAVNDELGQLDRLLAILPRLLRPGGRAVVISFHSLEDRRVKQSFRAGRADGTYDEVARRVITPGDEEVAVNRRSRPARLRWARRAGEGGR
jgi:16S rRNA (cytosine1402-N4)-methyltransferase